MPRDRPHRWYRRVAVAAVLLACWAAASAGAASSNVTVTVQVPSSTQIDTTGCASGTGAVSFGTVLPGTSVVAGSDCTVSFGSSNDTAALLLSQQDASGGALASIAQPSLDTAGFGSGTGKVTAPVGPGSVYARPSAVATDGSILIATYRSPSASGDPFTVTKLLPDGSAVDTAFGTSGTANITLGSGVTYARGMAVQPDGKIIVVGSSDYGAGRGYDLGVARFNADGTPDTGFGTNGVVALTLGSNTDSGNAVLVRPDGRILVGGETYVAGTATFHTAFVQLLPNGTLDPAFGTNGVAMRDIATEIGAEEAGVWKLALQPDGKVVYVGAVWRGSVPDAGIGRIDRFGRWDATFHGDGFREFGPTTSDNPVDITLDALGRVLLVWASRATNDDTSIVRFQADGTDDATWNGGAPVTLDLGGADVPGAIRVDRSGNVIALSGGTLGGSIRQQVVIRRTATGAPDTSFGGANGYVATQVGDSLDKPSGILDVDGRIVTTGHTRVGTRDVIYAARFQARQIGDWVGGSRTWSLGTSSMFGVCLRALSNASALWTADGDGACTAVDTDPWRAVPAANASGARIATTALGQTGTARLRFGMRVAAAEPVGSFTAPLSFSVVAPAA